MQKVTYCRLHFNFILGKAKLRARYQIGKRGLNSKWHKATSFLGGWKYFLTWFWWLNSCTMSKLTTVWDPGSDHAFCGSMDFGQFPSVTFTEIIRYRSWCLISSRIKIYLTYIMWIGLILEELFKGENISVIHGILCFTCCSKEIKVNVSCIFIATERVYWVTP